MVTCEHRPWPRPASRWVQSQVWRDLLFAHWPVPAEHLRSLVPDGLELDLYESRAWVAVVPFRMTGIRLRWTPPVPWLSAFCELNVRTYVTDGRRPGVLFASLDAANRIAVAIARRWYHLPYFHARMSLCDDGTTIRYASRRIHAGAPPAAFEATYAPTGPVDLARPGSLAHWLTERYCLYTADGDGALYRGEIDHAPWPLQPASATFATNAMTSIPIPDEPPLLHFARRLDVRVWSLQRL